MTHPELMTRAEWLADAKHRSIAGGFTWSKEGEEHAAHLHQRTIENAVRAGISIKPEVLFDYPDLAKSALAARAVPADPGVTREQLIDALIEEFKATGRVAWRYPRKKTISLSGAPGMPEADAVKEMRRVVEAARADRLRKFKEDVETCERKRGKL